MSWHDEPQQDDIAAPQVNLFLRVVRRRDDGYHDLASLFHVIDLGDGMEFTVLPDDADRDELRCDMEGVPTDDSNLVIKAGSYEHFWSFLTGARKAQVWRCAHQTARQV